MGPLTSLGDSHGRLVLPSSLHTPFLVLLLLVSFSHGPEWDYNLDRPAFFGKLFIHKDPDPLFDTWPQCFHHKISEFVRAESLTD